MTSALVSLAPAPGAPALVADLESVGIHVLGASDAQDLVREAVRVAPDVVVCWDPSPDAAFFDALSTLAQTSPLPLVVFTDDHAAEKIERSTSIGIQAYVVGGYGTHRLRPTIQLARARFARERALRDELRDVTRRFEERKLVDRAKGILMRAQQISEEDAFRILRTTSMHSKQRVGRVSQHVIDAARDAEAVNRTGLLRMLSQQLVKRATIALLGAPPDAPPVDETIAHIDQTLAHLVQALSKETYGDLLDAVEAEWAPLRRVAVRPVDRDGLPELDALAERVLLQAERLTTYLQSIGISGSLRVINVSGRQRMLAQRIVKQALLAEALDLEETDIDATRHAFELGLKYLNTIPLISGEIREDLVSSRLIWDALNDALDDVAASRHVLAETSDALTTVFDRLTDRYERSMQILIG